MWPFGEPSLPLPSAPLSRHLWRPRRLRSKRYVRVVTAAIDEFVEVERSGLDLFVDQQRVDLARQRHIAAKVLSAAKEESTRKNLLLTSEQAEALLAADQEEMRATFASLFGRGRYGSVEQAIRTIAEAFPLPEPDRFARDVVADSLGICQRIIERQLEHVLSSGNVLPASFLADCADRELRSFVASKIEQELTGLDPGLRFFTLIPVAESLFFLQETLIERYGRPESVPWPDSETGRERIRLALEHTISLTAEQPITRSYLIAFLTQHYWEKAQKPFLRFRGGGEGERVTDYLQAFARSRRHPVRERLEGSIRRVVG